MSETELCDFSVGAGGVKRPELENMGLDEGGWVDAVAAIRDTLDLETVTAQGFVGGCAELSEKGFFVDGYEF